VAKAKLKSKAQIYVPQSRDEVAADIRKIGDLQRDIARHEAFMNDKIAALTQECQANTSAMRDTLAMLQQGVQSYCEANRHELTNNGKVKFANLVTGVIKWQKRPPSVKITGAAAVIEALKRLKLSRFLREKTEINKEAILNEPKAVEGVAGIKIIKDLEDFVIEPFEQEVQS
jgi:phage host-nuclease inhibitor protein Gam